ncbi:hypothetical protein [Arthrobacter sp. B0490]|uniref:hypothetical protein n=1 Tax=Arthrobacter sp. B0490 TaxID=2058891 RepID=UPI0011B01F3C|nr:hypothetical protein [Arthrobacter sp. B0490]
MRFSFGNIQADEDGYYWLLNGAERRDRNDALDVLEGDLHGISATHLRQMYRRLEKHLGYSPSDLVIHTGEAPSNLDVRDVPDFPHSNVKLSMDGRELLLGIECFMTLPEGDSAAQQLKVENLIAPLLDRKRFSLSSVSADDYTDNNWLLSIYLGFNPRARYLTDLYKDALDVQALIYASSGDVTRSTVADLVRAGHVMALLGQPEGAWLEAKRQHADLDTELGKIRLAQWVAQFANTDEGGVLVFGLATRKRNGVDVISDVTPMPRDQTIRRRYVQALDVRIVPPIEDLRVELLHHGEGDLLLIEVPVQSEENKPFLVHGAVIDGKVQGNFFSIVRRRQDEMASTHPANVHANLTVGRAFLRRGDMPRT